jgi:dTDP-4-amino-4,6-dideoxygalactose transaminase
VQVKYLDLPKQFSGMNRTPEFDTLFRDCQFILGPQVEEFERRFAALCGVSYAIGLNSGTDALILALKALGIGSGDEVVTAPNSFIASAGAIAVIGARPVFVDVGDDYTMDPALIEKAITPRTRALLPVHLTGNPAAMKEIMAIAEKHGLAVVEDAAQAVGASIYGRMVGSFGIGCFSLHPLKNLNVGGDGGVVTTNSAELNQKIRLLRNHGLINRNESEVFGYCSRLDSIQARVGLFGLDTIDEINGIRNKHAKLYDSLLTELTPNVVIPPRRNGYSQVYHTYVVQVDRRDELMAFLEKNGIETKIHYPIPIHLQKAASYLGYKKGDFPKTEQQAARIITLPVNQFLSDEQIRYVASMIKQFYEKSK